MVDRVARVARMGCLVLTLVGVGCGEDGGGAVDAGGEVDAFRVRRDAFMEAPDAAPDPDAFVPPDAYMRTSCEDFTPPSGSTCFTDTECGDPNFICRLPILGDVCRSCELGANDECGDENPCGAGLVCVTYNPQCQCPTRRCEAPCTGATCPAASCQTDGYVCPTNAVCQPDHVGANEHGCIPKPCTIDSDCDCGYCATGGRCANGIGVCESLDSMLPFDAGPIDAAVIDAAASDAGVDAAAEDAAASDAGSSDAGSSDAGTSDAGPSDAGRADANVDAAG